MMLVFYYQLVLRAGDLLLGCPLTHTGADGGGERMNLLFRGYCSMKMEISNSTMYAFPIYICSPKNTTDTAAESNLVLNCLSLSMKGVYCHLVSLACNGVNI